MLASDRCNSTSRNSQAIRGFAARFGALLRRRQSRQAFEAFRSLSDYQLRDLGVQRGDILAVLGGNPVVRQSHDFA